MARIIESPSNPLVKSLVALKDRRARDRTGTFLVEGARECMRALSSDLEVLSFLHAPGLHRAAGPYEQLHGLATDRVPDVVELSDVAFGRLSMRQSPDGLALLARRPSRELGRLGDLGGSLVLVLDGVEKPGNLGALFRTADAAGVGAVLVSGAGTDLENPNVIRASQGSVFAVPNAVAEAGAIATYLRQRGHRLVATSPRAKSAHWEADYRGSVAVLLGAEDVGLAQRWLSEADELVSIPMSQGAADSLNVSVAGAVVLFEAVRQRALSAPRRH